MPRNSLGALALIVGCAGCSPARVPVYVDLNQAAAAEASPLPVPTRVAPAQPAPVAGGIMSVPALAETTVRFPAVRATLEVASRRLKASQEKAFENLLADLREAYRVQAKLRANEYRKGVVDDTEALFEAALGELDEVFQSYAQQRAEPLSRLAFLRGTDTSRPKVAQEIGSLQARLELLDSEFDSRAAEIFSRVEAANGARKARIEGAVRKILADFDTKAVQDASRFTREVATGIKSELASRAAAKLPAEPGASVSIPAGGATAPVPDIGASSRDNDRASRVRHDLTIWLAINGYERAGGSSQSTKDGTEEFIKWRRNRQAGL